MIQNQNGTQTTPSFSSSLFSPLRNPWLWGIVGIQGCTHLFFLTVSRRTLWLDEAYSALMARRSFSDIHQALRFDAGPPLYYDLLRLWRLSFGESELALRSMSLVFALLTTLLVFLFASHLWNHRTGIITASLFAFSPLTTAYIHEARNYTLFAFLCIGYAWMVRLYFRDRSPRSIVYGGLLLLALVYTHNIGWFVAGAGMIYAILQYKDRRQFFTYLICFLLVILLYLPWIPTLFTQLQNTEWTIEWIKNFWSPWAIVLSFSTFIPGGTNPVYLRLPSFPHWFQIPNAFLWLFFLLLAVTAAWRKKQQSVLLCFVFLLCGLFGPYLYSWIQTPVYLAGRTDYGLFPFWCLLTGYGISQLHRSSLRKTILSFFFLQMVFINVLLLFHEDTYTERPAILYLQNHAEPGDVILCTGLTRPPLEYALQNKQFVFMSYPRDMQNHLAHLNEEWYIKNMDLQQESESILHLIKEQSDNDTFWIVCSQRPINQPLLDVLNKSPWATITNKITTRNMGLRKLDEPVYLLRVKLP